MGRLVAVLIWLGLLAAVILPVWIAASSPLLQYRQPVYVAAGFAGILALGLLLVQPLLARGVLPALSQRTARTVHRLVGGILVMIVIVHVLGLWITSPPDVVDALLFRSPTPFSAWGVIAMWALFLAGLLAALRQRLRYRLWRNGHLTLVAITVLATVIHALQIEGTMGTVSKAALCLFALIALIFALVGHRLRRAVSRNTPRP